MSQFNKYLEIVQEGKDYNYNESLFLDVMSQAYKDLKETLGVPKSSKEILEELVDFINNYYKNAEISSEGIMIINLNRDPKSVEKRNDYLVNSTNIEKLKKEGYIIGYNYGKEQTKITLNVNAIQSFLKKEGSKSKFFATTKTR